MVRIVKIPRAARVKAKNSQVKFRQIVYSPQPEAISFSHLDAKVSSPTTGD